MEKKIRQKSHSSLTFLEFPMNVNLNKVTDAVTSLKGVGHSGEAEYKFAREQGITLLNRIFPS